MKEIDQLKDKIDKLKEAKGDSDRKEQEWSMKMRHFEEKIEKDGNKLK